jgi:sugar/nucleoside kinase (ribokinase family)
LIVSDYEIGAIAECETVAGGVTDEAACRDAARRALELGAMDVVVVHYVYGVQLVACDGTEIRRPSVRVPDDAFAGANGAGDAFAAGFLCARQEGWDCDRRLTLGHAAAACCLRSITTSDSVGTIRECLDLAAAWGWRS